MKKLIAATLFGAVLAFTSINASAADKTLKGTATCAKCDLGTASKCLNVLQVKESGKTVTYLLEGKAGKPWHKNVCKGSKQVTMTGAVSKKGEDQVFTVTEIK